MILITSVLIINIRGAGLTPAAYKVPSAELAINLADDEKDNYDFTGLTVAGHQRFLWESDVLNITADAFPVLHDREDHNSLLVPVPEPSSILLMCLGLAVFAYARRKRLFAPKT